jgi:hypothetical protein
VSVKEAIKALPIPESSKSRMVNLLTSSSHPILKESVVLMIVVFKDSSDVEVNNISEQYWTMLIRWVKKRQRDGRQND